LQGIDHDSWTLYKPGFNEAADLEVLKRPLDAMFPALFENARFICDYQVGLVQVRICLLVSINENGADKTRVILLGAMNV
jgi:hypothetical protein